MSNSDPIYLEALQTFREKYAKLGELDVREPYAFNLATVGADGQPTVRTLLMRAFDEHGFCFFTNSRSRKGQQIAENPKVALSFYLDRLAEQIHIEGRVEKVTDEESDAYWTRRPRQSQIGAWASQQSEPLDSRESLLNRVDQLEAEFADADVPRPDWWHGYRVIPTRIEFWCGRDARLHERIVYQLDGDNWTKCMLNP